MPDSTPRTLTDILPDILWFFILIAGPILAPLLLTEILVRTLKQAMPFFGALFVYTCLCVGAYMFMVSLDIMENWTFGLMALFVWPALYFFGIFSLWRTVRRVEVTRKTW